MKKKLQSAFHSRQYMISKDFELYFYDDRNLAKIEAHSHNYYEFYFFVEGDISMQIGKDLSPLRFGDIIVIPPHVPHRAVIHSQKIPYRRFVFWISQEFYDHLRQVSSCYSYLLDHVRDSKQYIFHLDRIASNTLQSKMLCLLEEMQADRFGRELQLTLYVDDLILRINRIVYEMLEPEKKVTDASLYANLVEYIENHLDEELSLERLAEEFYVSKYHIAHVFKDNIGLSIHQYITKKRLLLCEEAIRAKMNITDVYQTYGFGDYSSFYRAFKKEYGISPKEYRDLQMDLKPDESRL